MYEKKVSTKIVGILDKKDDEYIVTVDGAEYKLSDIIDDMLGGMITLSSEEEI
jgi:hypothetical protein